jgi:uncharacterized membrane protein YphA (DoxX/SURF4 family)
LTQSWAKPASLLDDGKRGQNHCLENFYKNLSITCGFLLLFVTGAGKYSVDAWLGVALP